MTPLPDKKKERERRSEREKRDFVTKHPKDDRMV